MTDIAAFRHIDLFFVGVATAATLFLGFVVFLNGRKSVTNRTFFLLSIAAIFYGVFNYASYTAHDHATVLLLLRYVIFSALWYAFFLFHFFYVFPKDTARFSGAYRFVLVPAVVGMSLLNLTPLVFSGLSDRVISSVPVITPGPFVPMFGLVAGFLVIGSIVLLLKKMRHAKKAEKTQFRIIAAGTLITFPLYIIFNTILPLAFDNVRFVPLASVFAFPFIACTAYAIVRHGFLDIKVVSTEVLVFVLSVAVLFEIIFSKNTIAVAYNTSVFLLVLGVGLLLIKSVRKEVTERAKIAELAASLEKANARLRGLDKQKTEFLSIASHQLRTPLSIIKGYVELIGDGAYGAPSKELQKVLGDLDETNERLVKLVDEFLDISRIEQGRTKFTFGTHSMDDVIDGVVKEIGDRAKDKGLTLARRGKKAGMTSMDDDKIRHVVFNFIDNAIKYSNRGMIAVSAKREDGGIAVRVKDAGVGFGKEDEGNFFQKFYRGENVKTASVGGTGLGLFVCRKFIEAHKGRVWANSAGPGKGSEFGFWIPIK